MTKIRKVKRTKKYQYNVNRKRMNRKRLPALESSTVKNAWNRHMSSEKNFKKMGLVFNVNKDIKALNKETSSVMTVRKEELPTSTSIVKKLEEDAKVVGSGTGFRFSKDQVDYLTYLLDKYGNDFKAMSRDKKNYLQQTWKQIRRKINLFKNIPAHYNEYLSRNSGNETQTLQ